MEANVQGILARADRGPTSGPRSASSGPRIALVHDWLTGMRGGEKCLEVLCQAFPNATLHTLIHRQGTLSPIIEGMAIRTSPLQRLPGIHRQYRKLLPLMPLAARTWRVGDVDMVVSLSHCVAKAVRVPPGVPHVSYCFTPMRYAWQGRDAYLDGWNEKPAKRAIAGAVLDRMRDWDRATASRVTHFVAISEAVRQRIAECYGRPSRVIHPPVNTSYFTPAPQIPREDFYLCVSALVPYKRTDQAVSACAKLGRRLVVIGSGTERERLERIAGPKAQFLGWQPDDVIRDHYRRCRALLFPGEEDFGIVPVEAMACGSAVIALGRGGASETVDPRSGLLYEAASDGGLASAILEWERMGRPLDSASARQRAEMFSLPLFRDRLLGYLEAVAAGRDGDRVPPAPHVAIPDSRMAAGRSA